MTRIKRALISVSDKTGLVDFVRELKKFEVEIISTGGTYKTLKDAGLQVLNITEVTGFPEILDGRVKTLHPAIHGGLLARRDIPEHMETIKKHGIYPIDLVVVNLYPFESTVSRPGVALEEAIENIDIGGPSMIRSAAKNFSAVAVVVNPGRYPDIIAELRSHEGAVTAATRQHLALEAFEHTSYYDSIISTYLSGLKLAPDEMPDKINIFLKKTMSLRYGENPHQKAAFYAYQKSSQNWAQLQGKELSFNNLLDLEAALNLGREFSAPAAVIVKHNNPCGVAESPDIFMSYLKALEADPVSAYGGIVALNRPVDEKLAKKMAEIFLEVIVAPEFSSDALKVLAAKPNLRVIKLSGDSGLTSRLEKMDFKKVAGGFLVQEKDTRLETEKEMTGVTAKKPAPELMRDLIFSWKVVKHTKSNAIVVVKDGATCGIGVGQTSRVKSVEQALKQAGENSRGAVLASDAFFPFPDSVELAAAAGISAIIQPGGSVKDKDVITAADLAGLSMVFTGHRHFKH